MPTYRYQCEDCNYIFEEFHSINKEIKECPKCYSGVKKVIGAPGVIFKGTGFYINDNLLKKKEK